MAKSETIPVQIDAEKLCKHTLNITNNLNNFPKKYRFTLVDRILRITFDIHDYICDANNSYDMSQRVHYIENAVSSWKNHAQYCTDDSIFKYYENKLRELRRHRNGY